MGERVIPSELNVLNEYKKMIYVDLPFLPDNTDVGLLGYWKLNESSGTVASDSSGNSFNGTLLNSPTWVAAKFGNGLSFNGTTAQQVSIADNNAFTFNDGTNDLPFSISLWIKLNASTNQYGHALVTKRNTASTSEYQLGIFTKTDFSSNRYLNLSIPTSNWSGYIQKISNDAFPIGSWNLVTATYSGNKNSSGIKLYLNGSILTNITAADSNYTGMSNTINPLIIGSMVGTAASTAINGIIDDVRIYNRELTAQDCSRLYTKTPT